MPAVPRWSIGPSVPRRRTRRPDAGEARPAGRLGLVVGVAPPIPLDEIGVVDAAVWSVHEQSLPGVAGIPPQLLRVPSTRAPARRAYTQSVSPPRRGTIPICSIVTGRLTPVGPKATARGWSAEHTLWACPCESKKIVVIVVLSSFAKRPSPRPSILTGHRLR